MKHITFAAAALAIFAVPALAEDITKHDSALGEVLADANGMTLYTFDKDTDGTSSCYDQCAENWPPLIASEGAAAYDEYGLTERTNGTMQWTYDGKPLYLFIKDAAPGDTAGDGVKDVWHVVKE